MDLQQQIHEAKPPKMTQEAWAVVDRDGKPICVKLEKCHAESQQAAWGRHLYTVVHIPPLPMETEQ